VNTLQAQRLQTANLIAASPRNIALVRERGWTSDGAGGRVPISGPIQLPAVTRYLGLVSDTYGLNVTNEGERHRTTFILVGPYNDDIQAGDTFDLDGLKAEVTFVHADRSYQTKAEVRVVTP
jgi:hypothetical protein